MKPQILLHIGTNKTGTSAIQRFFNQNRELLKKHGVLYPLAGCSGDAHYGLSQVLGFENRRPGDTDRAESERASLAQALSKEITKSGAQHVLMSSEYFILPRAIAPVREFFSPFDVRIVVYLRRHDEWWESVYNQAVKMVVAPPWGRKFEAYLRFQKQKNPKYGLYRDLVDRWAKVFGKENIIVRPYERQQNAPDIVYDLLRATGLESVAKQLDRRSERANESVSPLALNLIGIYQRLDVDPEVRSRLIQHAMAIEDPSPRVSAASPRLRRRLVQNNLEDYEYIAREYLGREDGQLFYSPLPDPKEPWEAPKTPSVVTVVEETVKALHGSAKRP